MNFMRWLLAQNRRDDAIGDLACDVLQDDYLGIDACLEEIEERLDAIGASDDVKDALREAWQTFNAQRGETT